MKQILKNLRHALMELADEKTRESSRQFFKETDHQKVKFLGVKSAAVNKVAKEHFAAVKDMPKAEVFALCENLWQSNYLEEAGIASDWAYRFHKDFKPGDFAVFESWIGRYVTNWGSCDVFCNHTVGTFLEMYPRHITKLKQWAKSPNMWMRRAAAVSLIHPARKELFHKEIFEIATILLHDSEDLVQKGYGWMLKAASEADQEAVFRFVMAHKATMPRTALRYAIEKMPQHLKKEAMAKETAVSASPKPRKSAKKAKVVVPHLPERYAWVDAYCLKKPGCSRDYQQEWDATRYMLNGKFFVMIGQRPGKESIITLKLEPSYGNLLRLNHKEVTPGYYMNKLHWNSISLESGFSDDLLKELIDESYNILFKSLSKKAQQAILDNKTP